jgi:hypothetical protein
MTLQTALTELVAFARENGAYERPRIRKACERAEERIGALQRKREARQQGRKCKRCAGGCFGLLCWNCWHVLPASLRCAFEGRTTDGAKTTVTKTEATRAIFEWIQKEDEQNRAVIRLHNLKRQQATPSPA